MVLNSANMRNKKSNDISDEQVIKEEIAKIKRLRSDYDILAADPLSNEAIEAYLKWHEESVVVFSHYFNDDTSEFVNFKSVDDETNSGFRLKDNYQKIRRDFCVLLDRLERGDFNKCSSVAAGNISANRGMSKKRIFISHASKDKELVSKFVDSVMLLGMGIESEIIAYTSREDTGVTPGESIPQFIQNNIACADVVLLMISDNYKDSEVCLNEMGAAWALDKHIIQILLPNTSFDKLGWLESLNKAIRIDCDESVDRLCELFSDKLDFGIKPSVWNRNKSAFMSYCASLPSTSLSAVVASDKAAHEDDAKDELGFLDYRELVEADVQTVFTICQTLTDAMNAHTETLTLNTARLKSISTSRPNISQTKEIMRAAAREMDGLSEKIEENAPGLKNSFFSMIDNAAQMKALVKSGKEENMKNEYDSINGLLISLSEAKSGMASFKGAIDTMPKAEQSINRSRKRLSNNLGCLIGIFDDCISKSQELLTSML